MKVIAITILLLSTSVFADGVKVFVLKDGIKISILEVPFDPSSHIVENCDKSQIPCLIDGHFPYGTAFDMPRSQLEELTLSIGNASYKLDTTGMYNAWGKRPLEYKGSIRYLGAHCYNERSCTLRGVFSDAAGSYVAEWKIINGKPHRTVLSSSEDIMYLFMKNIDPPFYE